MNFVNDAITELEEIRLDAKKALAAAASHLASQRSGLSRQRRFSSLSHAKQNVRFGSLADIETGVRYVCFAPKSGSAAGEQNVR